MSSAPVELRERVLYHQIHPLKLAVDIAGSVASTVLLWRHSLLAGMLVTFLPSIAVTAAMLRWADLRRQKGSAFGRYVAFHMTRTAEAVRFGGQIVIWVGAWVHAGSLIAAGAVVVVLGWTYSLPRWLTRGASARSEPIPERK
jgi:hypothetical protein